MKHFLRDKQKPRYMAKLIRKVVDVLKHYDTPNVLQ